MLGETALVQHREPIRACSRPATGFLPAAESQADPLGEWMDAFHVGGGNRNGPLPPTRLQRDVERTRDELEQLNDDIQASADPGELARLGRAFAHKLARLRVLLSREDA